MRTAEQLELVVGVGASAGGLAAFKQLFAALPADSGMAFLLVQHLDPTHKSLLAELLAPHTRMAVRDADQGAALEPNTVYIIRPDTALAVRSGRIELSPPTLHRGVRLPVDHLFRSLANEYGGRSVGIVLSGAGSDGSAGIRDIKAKGGLIIAQEPESSGYRGMPQSAIDTGVVDLVLEISDMPAALRRFAALPATPRLDAQANADDIGERTEQYAGLGKQAFGRLAAILEAQSSFNLRVYKHATVERRVLRRVALSGFNAIEPYLEHLRFDSAEQQTLVREFLISVTEFFRDPAAFRVLRETVIEPTVAAATAGSTLRAWVAGCATGEEAYSIGMEFFDCIYAHNKRLGLQIFATDVDQEALAFARAASYPPSISERVSAQRLQTYFKPHLGKGYQVRQPLRDAVSFAMQDLTKDPPFSRMNLVSCRNVMIYLTSEAQRHVLNMLHFALEPDGFLFLSTSESTGPRRELFSTISKDQRIYRKRGASRASIASRSLDTPVQDTDLYSRTRNIRPSDGLSQTGGDLARRAVLAAVAPPTLVISEDGSVLFSHGELGPYIRIPEGDNPRFELNSVLRPELATRVRGVLHRCRREKQAQFALSSPNGDALRVRIGARLAPSLGSDVVILTFEALPEETAVTIAERPERPEQDVLVEQLESELQATREDLRTTVEELETSIEELRSSNDESMSINEELQSANEELEATTEELRSLNEELTIVNAQLQEKVELVELAHDDLNNFFSSTKIATVFLDGRLCIKRFTPAAQQQLGIDHADTGRFVGNIARELLQHDLAQDAESVLDHLRVESRVMRTTDGRCITRQALPYRTENRRIEGVVVTFTDVTELSNANEELATRTQRLELAWEVARGGVLEHRLPLDESTYISDQWAQVFGYRLDELPSYERLLPWLFEQAHPDDHGRFEQSYQNLIEGKSERYVIELRFRHKGGHWLWVREIAKILEHDELGRARHLLRMMIDITDLKEAEASLRESELRFREMADGLPLMVWVHNADGDLELVNQTFCEYFGVKRDVMKGGRWQILVHSDDADSYTREFYACINDKRPFHAEARVKHADGTWHWIESWGRPRLGPEGQFRGFVGTSADITARREMEMALRTSRRNESQQRQFLETLLENAKVCVAVMEGDELRYTLVNRAYQNLRPDVSMVGRTVAEIFPEAVAVGVDNDLRQVLHTGEMQVQYGYHAPVPGRLDARWDHQVVRLPESEGRARSVLLITWESTEHYRTQGALRESEQRLQIAKDAAGFGVYAYDIVSGGISWDERVRSIWGVSADEPLSYELFLSGVHPGDRVVVEAALERACDPGGNGHYRAEYRIINRHDGKTYWASSTGFVEFIDGEAARLVGAVQDVTVEKDAKAALLASQMSLQEADRQKDEFLAMLGHELRNPLAAIRTASELLRRKLGGNPEFTRMQEVLDRQTLHMAKLLDGLLDISRIIRGKIRLESELLDLRKIVREVTSDLREGMTDRQLEIRADIPPEPLLVEADRVRLAQIVNNLLSNAVKYTPDGGAIHITLSHDSGDGTVVLEVKDTGVGIEAELLPHVFEIFRQSKQSIDRSAGGLGLGLALVKTLVERQGGSVEARSEGPGAGAEFSVKFPLSHAPSPSLLEGGETSDGKLRILLIEDNEDAAEMLKQLLELAEHEVTLTYRGKTGLALARELRPDVVLCDLGLPDGVSGFDVARELRSDKSLAGLGLIALSGYGQPEDKEKAAEAGFDAHLIKPIDMASLERVLANIVPFRNPSDGSPAPS
ncbi:chemotaxis protein CheB [Haliangium ochraceum]|uniref:histidine kinase n=1 Tax=Haliangium ochraceum (strain DSM 14365 / JCM 11303 / SMP-2) TaxID=502025 RepID=D0LUR8_HALO1|nr:chemotaxis protein CheB [Haliangium ochraceum]ACY13958.1 signal transduction histidine kinase with CheB and CheR activity [Haliangium ochraceum DSM 14365]